MIDENQLCDNEKVKGTKNEHQALETIDRRGHWQRVQRDYKTIHHRGLDLFIRTRSCTRVSSSTSTAIFGRIDDEV